jgi:zinc-ribbon domain
MCRAASATNEGAASGDFVVSVAPDLPTPSPAAASAVCPVCGAPVAPEDARCPACGYDLAGVDGRPGAYSRWALWWTVAGFVAIYAIVLVIVAITN